MNFNALTVFRRTLIGLFALFVLLVCFILGVFFYNHYSDEELSPEAAAYFSKPIISPPLPENNAVFSIWGIRGEAGADTHALGVAYWNHAQLALRAQQPVPEAPADLPLPQFPKCPKGEMRCFAWLGSHVDVATMARQHHLLLQRYRALRKNLSSVSPNQGLVGMAAPLPVIHSDIRRLWELETLRYWNEGEDQFFLNEIAADTLFWTNTASNAAMVIDKALANAYIQTNYSLLAEAALSQPQRFRKHIAEWQLFLTPLPAAFFDMRGAMWGEHAAFLCELHNNFVLQTGVKDSASGERPRASRVAAQKMVRWLYQENATKNQLYRYMLKIQDIQKRSPDQIVRVKDEEIFDKDFRHLPLHVIKNPLGKIMLGITETDWSTYVLNLYRTDAKRRLISVQALLLNHEPAEYASLIQNLPADLRNPQTGKPPRLDLKAHLLEFDWVTRDGESKPLKVGLP